MRFAFDHGAGLVTAVLMRSGLAAYQVPVRWALALGALIALQSLLL